MTQTILEDAIHKQIGGYLRANHRKLKGCGLAYYTYSPAGEYRNKITAVMLKNKGVQRGDPDYRLEFVKDDVQYVLYVEIKRSIRSKLTKEQQAFFESKKNVKNVRCYIAYSVEDFAHYLNKFTEKLK
tara:strand:+ start:8502 stop:8885 length:384 start_codon:yes stop_codon:yes gene_type:complete